MFSSHCLLLSRLLAWLLFPRLLACYTLHGFAPSQGHSARLLISSVARASMHAGWRPSACAENQGSEAGAPGICRQC